MPPAPLTLSALARSRSLNRPRGAITSTVTESQEIPRHYFSQFRPFTGAKSKEPCAKRALIVSKPFIRVESNNLSIKKLQVSIEYLDGQTFSDGRSMKLSGCHSDAADILELLRMLKNE